MDRRSEPNRSAIYATALVAFLAIAGIAVVDREWVVGLFETALGLGFAVGR